jgi:hypothetical protein
VEAQEREQGESDPSDGQGRDAAVTGEETLVPVFTLIAEAVSGTCCVTTPRVLGSLPLAGAPTAYTIVAIPASTGASAGPMRTGVVVPSRVLHRIHRT